MLGTVGTFSRLSFMPARLTCRHWAERCVWHRAVAITVALAAAASACFGPASAAGADERVPDGVSASDWAGIRAAYEAGRHAAVPAEGGGFEAWNPGQRWTTRFDGRGFLTTPGDDAAAWTWGLQLKSYGRFGAERRVQTPRALRAEGGRVEYIWDEALTEWYINDRRGLEHGYTVHQRPAGGMGGECEPLRFTLRVRGGLRPRVSEDGRSVSFADAGGATVLTYSGLTVFDANGRDVPARFEPVGVGRALGDRLLLTVDDGEAVYPLTVDPVAQQAYLKASNTGVDQFGHSVAVSGDTVVVGAPVEASGATGVNGNQADNSALGAGAAYVFTRSGTTWSQQAYLKASNTGAGDRFGISVAISGDTVVVGAVFEASGATGVNGNQADDSAPQAGAAYVFTRSTRVGAHWSQQAYLKASNTASSDNFGQSVAISGDTVVVGSQFEDSGAAGVNGNQADDSLANAGATYVFTRSGTTWSQQAYLKASNPGINDNFGRSVAVSGDTAVVGAFGEDSGAAGVNGNQADNSAVNAGAAYVFTRSGTTWSQQAYLKAANTEAGDAFGIAAAISGDTVVVGAGLEDSGAMGVNGNQADNSALSSGAAYVFTRSGTTWSQHAYLKASNTGAGDVFGIAVAISGDTVVVGARNEASGATGVNGNQADDSLSNAGAAYAFKLYTDAPLTGACCRGLECSIAPDAAECAAFGGTYLGNGTVCAPVVRGGAVNACCKADFNNSGSTSVQDIFDFLAAYFSGCP